MRTKNLFRTLIAAGLAIISLSTFGQLTTNRAFTSTDTTTAGETTNYVTVGSRVPFQTNSTLDIWRLKAQGIIDSYAWKWVLANNGTVGASLYNHNGSATITALSGTIGVEDMTGLSYYVDSVISVDFPTAGTVDLFLRERTISDITGLVGCEGNIEHLPIRVVNAPTVAFNEPDRIMGGCGADVAADNNIPITVSGSGSFTTNFQVTYRIEYKALSSASFTDVLASGTIAEDDGTEINTGWSSFSIDNAATNTVIAFNITNGNYGTYKVTLQGVTDPISRKSLNTKANYETDGLPIAAERVLTIYALPTPVTQAIQHTVNNGW